VASKGIKGYVQGRAVEVGFKKPRFLGFKKKTGKAQCSFFRFLFLSCSLINKSHIQILIVICAIHQFYLHS